MNNKYMEKNKWLCRYFEKSITLFKHVIFHLFLLSSQVNKNSSIKMNKWVIT